MIRPNYRIAEVLASVVWGLFGILLIAGGVNRDFKPIPALNDVEGPLLIASGIAFVLSTLTNVVASTQLMRFETTRWKWFIVSDMLRIWALCATAYAALSANPVAVGWAVLGCGFSLTAGARMWVVWAFLREVHRQRAIDRSR